MEEDVTVKARGKYSCERGVVTIDELVVGRTANGRIEWKTKNGKTLKEIQEAEASV